MERADPRFPPLSGLGGGSTVLQSPFVVAPSTIVVVPRRSVVIVPQGPVVIVPRRPTVFCDGFSCFQREPGF